MSTVSEQLWILLDIAIAAALSGAIGLTLLGLLINSLNHLKIIRSVFGSKSSDDTSGRDSKD